MSSPACAGGYNIFVGTAGSGSEPTTPTNTALITALTYNWTPTASPLGEDVCAVLQYQETIGSLVLASANSNEVCFSFPATPGAPTLSGVPH
jgi:hypothetical protein